MLLNELLLEDYRVLTRDDRANWRRDGVEELMDAVDGEKTILKQSPGWRDRIPTLTVYPDIYPERDYREFSIQIYHDGTADVTETYRGEAIPVIQFLISRWPAYADIRVDDYTFAEIAKFPRPKMADQSQWFHGTTSEHLPGILRSGLNPRDVENRNYRGLGGSEQGVVYLAADFDLAQGHAMNAVRQFGGAAVVIQINLTGLENRIINDKDVQRTGFGQHNSDISDLAAKRVRKRPGESSYLTLGTIAVKGRIPANRLTVVWTDTRVKRGRMQRKAVYFQFVDQLAALAKQLSKPALYDLFHIIAVKPSGWSGGRTYYADRYYDAPDKTINSVFVDHSAPKAFGRWLNGMSLRAARWRRNSGGTVQAQIVRLIDTTKAQTNSATNIAPKTK